jgi:hypothetical protein
MDHPPDGNLVRQTRENWFSLDQPITMLFPVADYSTRYQRQKQDSVQFNAPNSQSDRNRNAEVIRGSLSRTCTRTTRSGLGTQPIIPYSDSATS